MYYRPNFGQHGTYFKKHNHPSAHNIKKSLLCLSSPWSSEFNHFTILCRQSILCTRAQQHPGELDLSFVYFELIVLWRVLLSDTCRVSHCLIHEERFPFVRKCDKTEYNTPSRCQCMASFCFWQMLTQQLLEWNVGQARQVEWGQCNATEYSVRLGCSLKTSFPHWRC